MSKSTNNSKKVSVANFNTVFLENNEVEAPLLKYFDSIVMPALGSDIQREVGDDRYIIMNTKVSETDVDYVLTGYIVKKTVLERLSDLDAEGNLIELDDRYSAAPFSLFVIYLKNHRMIYIENQKGSPRLSSFRSTIKYVIEKYVRVQNEKRKSRNEALLPVPLVNVIGIPSRKSIENQLKDVEKINELTLRFFPLNGDGDINFSGAFGFLTKEARSIVGCKTGSVSFNSPKNKAGVIKLLSEVEGTVEPIIKVTDKNSAKRTIKNDCIAESMKMNIPGNNLVEEINNCITEGRKIDSIQYVSEENADIYERNRGKIVPFVKNKE